MSAILGLLDHPLVETQPTYLPIEIAFATVFGKSANAIVLERKVRIERLWSRSIHQLTIHLFIAGVKKPERGFGNRQIDRLSAFDRERVHFLRQLPDHCVGPDHTLF